MSMNYFSVSRNRCWITILLLLPFSFPADYLHAQSTRGVILGTVKDSSGALLAGAKVTITNVDSKDDAGRADKRGWRL